MVPGPCPACGTEIEYLYQTENIPYFFEILLISALCPECGYRLADTQLLKNAEPSRWELSIESPEDLNIRVVRSMNGIISIPELGVQVDPGPACEGFISNVEGVLNRIDRVVESVIGWTEDAEELKNATTLREKIADVKEGKLGVTLRIDDPTGNSAILGDRARIYPIIAVESGHDEPG
ncbi:MAG: ZPR1 zinc-finger domain protein [Methanoregulaceae archaeon PtaU1.Bin059]|nr:MAG: ZPR1 zinc-finger domain protein [Methanoregulaceae archaeon PtaB.Bin152]OPY40616.1 MAG: ZPR1 zinc-finger domain protein [Methanoregulaceae archaeon PtaU1.Bin059]